MKFADISKLHSQRCSSGDACNKTACWQHVARIQQQQLQKLQQQQKYKSNSSSTSSGCDSLASTTSSTASSKENCYAPKPMTTKSSATKTAAVFQQHQLGGITPQQLQQLRYYQQLQLQHLHVLQQQLLQQRRKQRSKSNSNNASSSSATLTCNQQYLLQQQQQQRQLNDNGYLNNNNNNNCNFNDYDLLNNNNSNNNNNNIDYKNLNWNFGGYNTGGFEKGQKSRRGMTEFSTTNDTSNKSHLSQPLQNSPRHNHLIHTQNSPQHYAKLNKHLIHANELNLHHQQHNNKNNQQTLPLNSSANLNVNAITPTTIKSATHSPLHYRPNNTPYSANAYYSKKDHTHQNTLSRTSATKLAATTAHQQEQHSGITVPHQRQYRQQQLQQDLRGNSQTSKRLPWLTQNQYQQYLNDLLLQQRNLQQQQQQLLSSKHIGEDEELSEESLKQNVAIVLNNLDRYNTALRSIIINEQVTASGGIFFDDNLLSNIDDEGEGEHDDNNHGACNNNFLLSRNEAEFNKMAAPATAAVTPESDYNSNATTPGSKSALDSNMLQQQQNVVGGVVGNNIGVGSIVGGGTGINGYCSIGNNVASNNLNCSLASSHDFTHDNSDYQWFLDYGYRDGCGGLQRSVLSSLSASYNGFGDLVYYEDLAKNLDANLAEVDMESFRAEDIHSLLSHLPSYCKSLGSGNSRLQQSLLYQQQQQHQQQQQMMYPLPAHQHGHTISQTSTSSTNELIDNSICKSELLFSPVKESHISVDSLDMDAYPDDGDIILTCKANKDNYTIAFEGSVLYSDDSFYAEPSDISTRNKQNFINLHSNLDDIVKQKALEVSMSRSEQAFAPNNRLQKNSTTQLQRYPSGNNNTSEAVAAVICHAPHCFVRKSNSLPNLYEKSHDEENTADNAATECNLPLQRQHPRPQQLNLSHTANTSTNVDYNKFRNLLPLCQMPISCSNNSNNLSTTERVQRQKRRCCCAYPLTASKLSHNSTSSSTTTNTLIQQQMQHHMNSHISGSSSYGNSSNAAPLNLVKLLMKQKSSNCSSEEQVASAQTNMDVSSGCWPSSDAAGSSSSSSLEQRLRKKSMNDSGKGSALSRHEEEEDKDDSAFCVDGSVKAAEATSEHSTRKKQISKATFSNDDVGSNIPIITNSPAHTRRSMPLRHPQLCQLAVESMSSLHSSEGSRSNSDPLTLIYNSCGSANSAEQKKLYCENQVQTATQDMITRSIQTSCGGSLSIRSSLNERFRCVPPSFLTKLNNLGAERQAPIYVIYPNYALPDLGFVKTHASSTDVIFSTFNYQMTMGNDSSTGSLSTHKKRFSVNANDDQILKTMDFKHVVDWDSLATLLPQEYRRRLKHIPEVNAVMRQLGSETSQRPLFCMTPPVRRSRPNICDCVQYVQQQHAQEEPTSISGSSQQPSSGYRGSSTLLTDDSQLGSTDPLKQMYVYQYEQQRMDSGSELSPAGKTTPLSRPRGILRKSSSVTARVKRNSMIEEEHGKLSNLEKRRSLQEPPYQHGVGSSEELLHDVFEEETELYAVPQPRKERLSRKDIDARARAENFLSSLPRSELKYYAEFAAILESSEDPVPYDAAALKKEVSHALCQQKKVSFNDNDVDGAAILQRQQCFSTSPNIRAQSANTLARGAVGDINEQEKLKIESNRFKRLQIQWELMSKDSNKLKELANTYETKSGGSTPTTALIAPKSRIPRPVSYPAGRRTRKSKSESNIAEKSKEKNKICCISPKINTRINAQENASAAKKSGTRSPSGILPPKRYSIATVPSRCASAATTPSPTGGPKATTPTSNNATRARTPTSRAAPNTAPSTPKRRVQSPKRAIPKMR